MAEKEGSCRHTSRRKGDWRDLCLNRRWKWHDLFPPQWMAQIAANATDMALSQSVDNQRSCG
jgi:hypothetical protein